MPYLDINQARIHYEEAGSGPETIVFSHGLLMSGEMFHELVAALSNRYRCITFDHRGQGKSEVTKAGYDMDSLTADAAALIRELDCSLVLMATTADPEPDENKGSYRRLAFVGRWLSFRLVVNPVMKIMFGKTFLGDATRSQTRARWKKHFMSLNRVGTSRAAHGVIDREGVYEQLDRIETPTLILVGDEDVATPLPKSKRMHGAIKGSKLTVIPRAGHSSSIEEPAAMTAALEEFLGL